MKKQKDRNKKDLSEFQRYVRGEMTKRQENAFQRKLQRDQFAAEALEGLETLKPDEALKDISMLEKRLSSRISRGKNYTYYRIAASVAVLMIISSIFLVVNRKVRTEEIGGIPSPAVIMETPEQTPVKQETKTSDQEQRAGIQEAAGQKGEMKSGPSAPVSVEEKAGVRENVVTKTDAVGEPAALNAMAQEQPLAAGKAETDVVKVAAVAEDAEVENPAAGMEKKAARAAAVSAAYRESDRVAPEPLPGMSNYEEYLRENVRLPQQLQPGDSVMVEIIVVMDSTGKIIRTRIIDSPGEVFSEEARRLIEEGPRWNPAKSGGLQAEDSVELKILFRR